MMPDLAGKVALVTGGGQGIGLGIGLELARAGAVVAIADISPTSGAAAAEQIQALNCKAAWVPLDVSDTESAQRCFEETIRLFGRVDVLVNNAGVFQRQLGLELAEDEFNRCIDINLTSIWRMVRAVVPHFRHRGGGKIVNIASVGGRRGVDFAAAYCASKAGVISLTQSLASSLAKHNINVNTVCPGNVATAMQDEIRTLRSQAAALTATAPSDQLLPGPLTASDIGHAALFFASDYSRNITGQALNVDRGYMMN